jgi:hypothetical protein
MAGVWRRVGSKGSGLTGGDAKHPLDDKNNILIRASSLLSAAASASASAASSSSGSGGSGGGGSGGGERREGHRRPSLPLTAPSTPAVVSYSTGLLAAGWLRKMGHINVNWKVRWCELVLLSDEEASFSYYANRSPGDSGWCSLGLATEACTEDSSSSTTTMTTIITADRQPSSRFSIRRDQTKPLGSIRITKETTILNRSSGSGSHKFALFNASPGFEQSGKHGGAHSIGLAGPNDSPEAKDGSRAGERLGIMGRVKSEVLFVAAVSEVS